MNISQPTCDVQRASRLCCYQLDPTKDARWAELVESHPSASVFHTVGWLETLKRTYGYEPIAFTTSPPTSALKNGLVFCHVRSWLTGSRLVSLPFSDHCAPLCDSDEELDFLLRYLRTALEHESWRYLEVRSDISNLDQPSQADDSRRPVRFMLHVLDLNPDLKDVFRSLDKDSVQRRIRHAERAGLSEKSGASADLLETFYKLFVTTRARHRLPSTPYGWFKNLMLCQPEAVKIRIAYHGGKPIASILTLRFRNVLYYKYGCSDPRFNNLGATPWLLWNAIAAEKATGATSLDMGRTQEDHVGLLRFKNHWVRQPQPLVYWSFPSVSPLNSVNGWQLRVAKRAFSCMPDRLLALTGRIVYRHIG